MRKISVGWYLDVAEGHTWLFFPLLFFPSSLDFSARLFFFRTLRIRMEMETSPLFVFLKSNNGKFRDEVHLGTKIKGDLESVLT